ncbi:MAG TPA: lipocalin-like domain-containing protein [Opitutaceae bacterium]|nr:lipocalin-like domain-containing protein [Opitutaceae bacterium]
MKPKAAAPTSDRLQTRILGMWHLESRIDRDAGGQRRIDPIMGADPLGVLCFSSDHFSAQFMRRDRTGSAEAAPARAGANNSSAVNGYDAYFGSYTLDEASGLLRTRLEGAITPANVGAVFERRIAVEGGKLTITLATTAADGTPVTRILTWGRVS